MDEQDVNLHWHRTCARTAARYDDIWFVDPEIGWAVNSNGQILNTTDGGASWSPTKLPEGTRVYWRCIGFVATSRRGWAGGFRLGMTSGRLYATTDGETWESIDARLPTEDAPPAICGLSVVNEQVVYASGTNEPELPAAMVKTIDGGATWSGWRMADHATLLVDTYFTTAERGWVVGGKVNGANPSPEPGPNAQCESRRDVKPVVLFTADGGVTWENRV